MCSGGRKVCDATSGAFIEPDYTTIAGYEAIEATCDTQDNDCDGLTDEDGVCDG